MCIIALKEKGVKPVDQETLHRCWNKNSDGAGFAYYKNNTWNVEKGLMTWIDFWEAYSAHKFTKNDIVICHFRVGTSGNRKGPDCTHPFVIKTGHAWEENDQKYLAEMRKINYSASGIVFHNGVVGQGEGINSDTMLAVMDWIAPLWRYIDRDKILDIMCKVTESDHCRWLITKNEQIYLLGKWITDAQTKVIYSNDGYKYTPPVVHHVPKNVKYNNKGWWNQACDPKYTTKDGEFDWETYHKDFPSSQDRGKTAVENWNKSKSDWAGKTPQQLGGSEFILDDDGMPFGLIDYEGNVILDDEYFAYDKVGRQAGRFLTCPRCVEEHNLVDSPYPNIGDTLCQRCGLVFWEATGEQCMNDPDIYNLWLATTKGGAANGNV